MLARQLWITVETVFSTSSSNTFITYTAEIHLQPDVQTPLKITGL